MNAPDGYHYENLPVLVPDGHHGVAVRPPAKGELYVMPHSGDVAESTVDSTRSCRIILKPKWKRPSWIVPGTWIWMCAYGTHWCLSRRKQTGRRDSWRKDALVIDLEHYYGEQMPEPPCDPFQVPEDE